MTRIGADANGFRVLAPASETTPATEVVLDWAAETHVGYRRKHNEDSVLAFPPLFAVADGMGGHAAGDVASHSVVSRLAEIAEGSVTTSAAIGSALRAATADIARAADDAHQGVGTTVAGVALLAHSNGPCWAVFNVGDSRVYLFDEELTQLTVDHSVVQELIAAGSLNEADAENHPDSNMITRAVGFGVDPIVDYWLIPVRAGTRLLLCSDGLTREVDRGSLERLLGAGTDPQATVTALLQAALASGGRDNITVVVVDVVAVTAQ